MVFTEGENVPSPFESGVRWGTLNDLVLNPLKNNSGNFNTGLRWLIVEKAYLT